MVKGDHRRALLYLVWHVFPWRQLFVENPCEDGLETLQIRFIQVVDLVIPKLVVTEGLPFRQLVLIDNV